MFYSDRLVVFGQNGCIVFKCLHLDKIGCIWRNCLYLGKRFYIWGKKLCLEKSGGFLTNVVGFSRNDCI